MYIDVNNINSNRKIVMSSKQNTPRHFRTLTPSEKQLNFIRCPQQEYHSLQFIVFLTIKFSINITKRYQKALWQKAKKL